MAIDIHGELLGSLELVYEQCRPEVRGLWREHVDPYLEIQPVAELGSGDWLRPWLTLKSSPSTYLDPTTRLNAANARSHVPGLLHDRPDARLEAMDADGVDVVVLHPSSVLGPAAALPNANVACGLLAGYNRYLGTYCRVNPARLRGSILLHAANPEWSAHEVGRLARRPWVAGASIGLRAEVPLWDETLTPILQALEDDELSLFFRSELYDLPRFPGHDDLWQDAALAHTLGPTWDAQRFLSALILGGVLNRHRRLQVCVLTGGLGWLPSWIDQLTATDRAAGEVAVEVLASGRVVLTVGSADSEGSVIAALTRLGNRCIAWGSGFPEVADAGPSRLAAWSSLRQEDRTAILDSNAARVIGGPAKPVTRL